jgi:lipopolysaccharide transport system ATP-binding protein
MNTIIVKGLGKSYKSYKNKIFKLISYFFPKEKRFFEIKTVLNKIDFEISSGESVGIIGVNGAGKSTLLKLITGTTSPTEGTIKVVGDISALLELGLGFHPDFTGRQNVFMSGQLMGLSKKEIELAMPDIEKFAEIGSAIDMAVKNYSSGMHVRLAFSIATYKRPDILIVDEALSVGDAYFQHKCFERIKSFRDQGSTLLFVSHDPGAIKNLCNRAILLYMGEIKFDGRPDDALDYYNSLISSSKFLTTGLNKPNAMVGVRSGSREIEIKKVMMFSYENEGYLHKIGDSVSIETQLKINIPVENLCVGVSIRDRLGNEIFGTNT